MILYSNALISPLGGFKQKTFEIHSGDEENDDTSDDNRQRPRGKS